jgi:broad specificity phosphatase PhoE
MHNKRAIIYLSRHCTTAWNVEGRLQGTVDLPLAEVGIREAKAHVSAIRELGLHRIVSSRAHRAYQTAMIYADALQLPLHSTPRLRELDHGNWEGRRVDELLADHNSGYAQWLKDPGSIAIPGGSESVQAAQQRAVEAVRDVALSFCGEPVLMVAHKHINAVLICGLLGRPFTNFTTYIVEDTLPHLLAADVVEALCPGACRNPMWTSQFAPHSQT